MHVVGVARDDVRAWRAAHTLTRAGYEVLMADIAREHTSSFEEHVNGIRIRHLHISRSFLSQRFRRWSFTYAAWVFIRGLLWLKRNPADIYHALDLPALPACYVASRL